MQYVGSKRRIAKDILSEIDKVRASDQLLVEPFCGGCNFTIHTRSPVLAADSNGPLIAMWRALQNGWQPPENLSEDEYRHIRLNQAEYPPELVAFIGLGVSFGAKWFGGFAKNLKGKNYCAATQKVLLKEIEMLRDVQFVVAQYNELDIPLGSVIYCDPPYANTTGYQKTGAFNSRKFYDWCEQKAAKGHHVFVSEYSAPAHWTVLREWEHTKQLNKNRKEKSTERLYKVNVCA